MSCILKMNVCTLTKRFLKSLAISPKRLVSSGVFPVVNLVVDVEFVVDVEEDDVKSVGFAVSVNSMGSVFTSICSIMSKIYKPSTSHSHSTQFHSSLPFSTLTVQLNFTPFLNQVF